MLTRSLSAAVVILGVLYVAAPAMAQDKQNEPPTGAPQEMTPEMKALMAKMLPGPAHAKLAKLAGEWTTKSRLMVKGAEPEATEGTAIFSVVMGGRFVHAEARGTMMGMPFQSAQLIGYNNGSKKYEAVWTYTMGTGMMTMVGTSEDDGKTIRFKAAWDNEVGIRETINITYKFTDDDHFTVTMGGGKTPGGSEGPEMVAVYTRKKMTD